jgi:DNA-binding transcriptional ArsR family regulator
MEHETLFTTSKWQILKSLELQPRSPLELARLCNTSVANVSQQLRLLEMAGLVTSKRISNRDKDKPRILYSIAGDVSYLIATSGSFVDKKLLPLSDYNKIVMRIWFFPKPQLHYALEKAFWRIEEHLDRIQSLAFDATSENPVIFYYQAKGLQLKPFTITDRTGATRQVVFQQKAPPKGAHILVDPVKSNQKEQSGEQ